jgi:hypothetical protein
VLLFFQLPDRPGSSYQARITPAQGEPVTASVAPCDENGNFCLLIDRRQFPVGHYVLEVNEIRGPAPGNEAPRSYRFNFEL